MTSRHGVDQMPSWLPDYARLYLNHVEHGVSIRQLARDEGCHASTILRRIRRIEEKRDDPLVDEALDRLRDHKTCDLHADAGSEAVAPPAPDAQAISVDPPNDQIPTQVLYDEARRILRRLAEPGTLMIFAKDLDKALVLRGTVRVAVLDRHVAQAFALQEWIEIKHAGRVTSYEITQNGRSVLHHIMSGAADGAQPPAAQSGHILWGERRICDGQGGRTRLRVNIAESPLGLLARRRDKDGTPFLNADQVAAGERLREDFELAMMGPRVTQNWERFMTGGSRGGYQANAGLGGGSDQARARVGAALSDLGPGLGDMVLRCCCFLEGLEAAEKKMGWSARSGKIVLRIALERLHRHYQEQYDGRSAMIG
ncbi:helix-turn-helix domain-containing protein [Rhodobacteraceae bacterium]|nr:helix-turn-helix domain-containing protein [Paracoccaceae bacterium]